jgi:hypothetical protein
MLLRLVWEIWDSAIERLNRRHVPEAYVFNIVDIEPH